jgi:hypothetical protein
MLSMSPRSIDIPASLFIAKDRELPFVAPQATANSFSIKFIAGDFPSLWSAFQAPFGGLGDDV